MADPVILLGMNSDGIAAIGLYQTYEDARAAVQGGGLPKGCFYSVMTPAMGTTGEFRKPWPPAGPLAAAQLMESGVFPVV